MNRKRLFNQLTLISLLLSVVVGIYYLLLFFIPQLPINPLPPIDVGRVANIQSTVSAQNTVPIPTNEFGLPPTWTPTPIAATITPRPTFTPDVNPTRTPVIIASRTATLNPAIPTRSPFKFTATTPFYTRDVYGVGCGGWFGVGGQVFGVDGAPLKNVSVVGWGGPIDEQNKLVSVSGVDNRFNKFYGNGAYELYLGTPNDFDFFVTVYENGRPAAPTIKLRMTNDCARDLVLINFQQNH